MTDGAQTGIAVPRGVYLVDASIYIFQAHFSSYVECLSEDDQELGALYGFAQFLLQFLWRVKPGHLAVAQDDSLFRGFRHQLCPRYKSNRELPDENLAMQLAGCREICALLGISSYSSRVFEADDIIGCLAKRIRAESARRTAICILSRDKDFAQLLEGEEDLLWDYTANRKRGREQVIEEFGVSPEQFPDYLGLVGDTSDCISGVPGVGPVKAKVLLREFNNLENVYRNLDSVRQLALRGAGSLADNLARHRDSAMLSKKLATIVSDAGDTRESFASAGISAVQVGAPDRSGLESFLRNYRFRAGDRERILRLAGQD